MISVCSTTHFCFCLAAVWAVCTVTVFSKKGFQLCKLVCDRVRRKQDRHTLHRGTGKEHKEYTRHWWHKLLRMISASVPGDDRCQDQRLMSSVCLRCVSSLCVLVLFSSNAVSQFGSTLNSIHNT
uniref:Putative secreted protein n=1 Tax=Amblyomma americanum TaxID=6943 RepID=A0A0C9SEW3_AMBAM